jgi:acetyltransferase-like isoleucine patch superfamily enzyme
MAKNNYSQSELRGAILGSFSSVAGGVRFHIDDNHPSVGDRKIVSNFPFHEKFNIESYPTSGIGNGIIDVGNDVWIGEDVHILSGVTIGDGAIIGAGSVVTKDIPPYSVAVGNPAKVIKYRFTKTQIKKLLKIKWWEWEDNVIKERIEDFLNVSGFIKKYEKKGN